MKFRPIEEGEKVYPGEYLLHQPSQQIVMCGALKREEGVIRSLSRGRLLEDRIENFQKIHLSAEERKKRKFRKSCSGCKG
mgnify:FL=1|jgi:hypothetical protein